MALGFLNTYTIIEVAMNIEFPIYNTLYCKAILVPPSECINAPRTINFTIELIQDAKIRFCD